VRQVESYYFFLYYCFGMRFITYYEAYGKLPSTAQKVFISVIQHKIIES